MKIKKDKIGQRTNCKTLGGSITINETHAQIFLHEGRYDLLEPIEEVKELKPLVKKTLTELRTISKGMDGYSKDLNKKQLIELIKNNDLPKSD